METVCEPVSFQDTLEHFGRSDYGTRYHVDGYGFRSDVKSQERAKVLDFILAYFSPTERIRLLSMPGESWAFEQMLTGAHRLTQVTGIERSATVFNRSKLAMPSVFGSIGSEQFCMQERRRPLGRAEIVYSRVTINPGKKRNLKPNKGSGINQHKAGPKSFRSNRLLHISTEAYMTALCTDYGANLDEKRDFFMRFYQRNAVWLDFTSQLCASVEESIRHLPMCLYPSDDPKPVVLTFMNARDNFRGAEKRVERVLSLQPALEYQKHWTYTGSRGTPMLTICATVAV